MRNLSPFEIAVIFFPSASGLGGVPFFPLRLGRLCANCFDDLFPKARAAVSDASRERDLERPPDGFAGNQL